MRIGIASLSTRAKVMVVTATSLVPLAGIVMGVIVLIFIPVFRNLENLTTQALFEMIPLHELQLALHRSTMAVRGSSEDDFDRAANEVERNYRQLMGNAKLRIERGTLLEASLRRWQAELLVVRPSVPLSDSIERSRGVNQYVAVAEHLAGELDELHVALHQDIVARLGETEARERQGYLLLVAAFALSMCVGTAGSILLTRDRKRLERRGLVDPLTGVFNRKAFEAAFRTLAEPASDFQQRKFSLITFDLDHFKSINDAHGHAAGDVALNAVVQAVRHCLRDGDHLARLGGDEFAILVPNVIGQQALAMAERIRQRVADTAFAAEDGATIQLRLSIGVASYPEDGTSLPDLSRAADAALYQAKRAGRNKAVASGEVKSADRAARGIT